MNDTKCCKCDEHKPWGYWKRGEWTCLDCMQPNDLSLPSQTQVGGDHYTSMRYPPWEAIQDLHGLEGLAFFLECTILCYAMRQDRKDGTDDAAKARHCAAKLAEVRAQMAESV